MKAILSLIIILSSILGIAQSSYEYNVLRKSVFFDDFDNNDNDWSDGYLSYSKGYVEDGYYYWESTKEAIKTSAQHKYISTTKDFELETRFMIFNTPGNKGRHSITFGGNVDMKSRSLKDFHFGITGTGYYKIGDSESSNSIKGWTQHSSINKTGFNTLTVRKVGNNIYFFINQTLVHSIPMIKFYGNYFGFEAYNNSKMKIDYIRIDYLEGSAQEYSSLNEENKSYFLNENFNDNEFGWKTDPNGSVQVKNGNLIINTVAAQSRLFGKAFPLDWNRDIEIESVLRMKINGDDPRAGIIWGTEATSDLTAFVLFMEGRKVMVRQYIKNVFEELITPKILNNYDEDGYNKFTVRKVGSKFNFFVNEIFIGTTDFIPPTGDATGFYIPKESLVEVDSYTISYIDQRN